MEAIAKQGESMSFLPKQIMTIIGLAFLVVFSVAVSACGRKEPPLPQKINQLYSFQNVYVYLNPTGSLTIMGTISGARKNVQALVLELEGYDENCSTCPFVPVESFDINSREMWNNEIPREFSLTVMPTKQFKAYRWRLVGHNSISGLPNVTTPVLKVEAPIKDDRDFIEIPVNISEQ